MINLKVFVAILCLSFTTSSCTFIKYQITPEFNKEQCSIVRKNFNKLKLGMNKDEVIPLIGGERTRKIYRNPGLFPEQKTQWEIWALCYEPESCIANNTQKQQCYEWQMIAFNTETNKVTKIFSEDPEWVGFF